MLGLDTPASCRVQTRSTIPRLASVGRLKGQRLCLGSWKKAYKCFGTVRCNNGWKVSATAVHVVKLIGPEGDEHEFEAGDDSCVLESAEKEGLELPYSCRSGTCGTCAGQIASGSVDQSQGSFLDEEQIEKGYVLTCIAQPQSDCVIYTHKQTDLT